MLARDCCTKNGGKSAASGRRLRWPGPYLSYLTEEKGRGDSICRRGFRAEASNQKPPTVMETEWRWMRLHGGESTGAPKEDGALPTDRVMYLLCDLWYYVLFFLEFHKHANWSLIVILSKLPCFRRVLLYLNCSQNIGKLIFGSFWQSCIWLECFRYTWSRVTPQTHIISRSIS